MKVAYLFVHRDNNNEGVLKKVLLQFKSLPVKNKRLFVISNSVNVVDENVEMIPLSNHIKLLFEVYFRINEFKPDIIYHRIWLLSPFLIPLLISKSKVVGELNSNVNDEMYYFRFDSFKNMLVYYYNLFTWNIYEKLLDGVVSLSYELSSGLNKKNIVIPNSIELSHENFNNKNKIKNTICFIGTPGYDWQGIDILIKIAKLATDTLHFNVIGYDKKDFPLAPKNITWHGFLKKNQYSKILKSSTVGIGTLGLFRKNHNEASPLKVREYLAFGLPVILPYLDTSFIDVEEKWILKIDIQDDLSFSEQVKKIEKFVLDMNDYEIQLNHICKYISNEDASLKRKSFFEDLLINYDKK